MLKKHQPQAPDPPPKRLLLFSAQAVLAKLITRWLRSDGYEVVVTGSLEEAIRQFRIRTLDAVLLDDSIAAPDVEALVQEVRALWLTHGVPVILIAYDPAGYIDEAAQEVVSDWLVKPFASRDLLRLLHAWLDPRTSGMLT